MSSEGSDKLGNSRAMAKVEPTTESPVDSETGSILFWSALPTSTSPTTNLTFINSIEGNGTEGSNYTRDEELAKVEMAVLALLFILTVLGNCIFLLGIFFRRQKMTRMYYFILHLSVADLITAFFNVLAQLFWEITYRFQGGNFLCKFVKYSQILGPYSSSYILVMTALDRYQAICHPLSNCTWTARRSKTMLGLAWAISFLFCLPQIFIFSYQQISTDPLEYDCWGTFPPNWGAKAYVTWYSITVFIIPLIILVFAYSCITRAIWINFNMKTGNRNQDHYERRIARQDSDERDDLSHFGRNQDESVVYRDGRLSLRSNASHNNSVVASNKKSLLFNKTQAKKNGNESNVRTEHNTFPKRLSASTCKSQSRTLPPSLSGHCMSAPGDKVVMAGDGCTEQEKNSVHWNSQKMFSSGNNEASASAAGEAGNITSFTTKEAHDEDEEQLHLIPKEAEKKGSDHITPQRNMVHSSLEKIEYETTAAGSTPMTSGSVRFPGTDYSCQHGCYGKRCNFCHLSSDDTLDKRKCLSDTENGINNMDAVLKAEGSISTTGGRGLLGKHAVNIPSPSPSSFSTAAKECDYGDRFSSKSSSRLLFPGKNRFLKKARPTARESRGGSRKGQQERHSTKSATATYVNQQPRTHSVKGISRAKIKTIKLTVTIICCYIFCSSPFIAAQLWSVYDPHAYTSSFFTGPTFTILTLLASLNSCVNPYIFLFFNPNLLQNCFRGLFRPRFPVRRFNNGNGSPLSRTMSHNKNAHVSVADGVSNIPNFRRLNGGNGNVGRSVPASRNCNHRPERSPNYTSSATSNHLAPGPLISHNVEKPGSHQLHHKTSINNGFEKDHLLNEFSERNQATRIAIELHDPLPQSSAILTTSNPVPDGACKQTVRI